MFIIRVGNPLVRIRGRKHSTTKKKDDFKVWGEGVWGLF